jgi:hypothetical protein
LGVAIRIEWVSCLTADAVGPLGLWLLGPGFVKTRLRIGLKQAGLKAPPLLRAALNVAAAMSPPSVIDGLFRIGG